VCRPPPRKKGNGKEFKVHLDGHNLLRYLTGGEVMTHPRKELPYFADTDLNNYDRRWIERSAFSVTAVQEIVAGFISTFKDFPPRQKPAKFNVDDVMAQMHKTGAH
jgi:hypothetical protein